MKIIKLKIKVKYAQKLFQYNKFNKYLIIFIIIKKFIIKKIL